MTKEEWIEKEVAEKEKAMALDAHNKNTLRSMLGKEHDFEERQAVREDSHTEPVEGMPDIITDANDY
jgi:hypothetical protein